MGSKTKDTKEKKSPKEVEKKDEKEIKVKFYKENRIEPAKDHLNKMKDIEGKAKIAVRINQMKKGKFGE